jgi:multiple antibiotic resistance protein
MSLFSAAALLFFVMDPLGNVPLFISALRHVDSARARPIIVRELLIALAILVIFLFIGGFLLELLQVSPAALTAGAA